MIKNCVNISVVYKKRSKQIEKEEKDIESKGLLQKESNDTLIIIN